MPEADAIAKTIRERMEELAPAVQEHARLARALAAIEESTPVRRVGRPRKGTRS